MVCPQQSCSQPLAFQSSYFSSSWRCRGRKLFSKCQWHGSLWLALLVSHGHTWPSHCGWGGGIFSLANLGCGAPSMVQREVLGICDWQASWKEHNQWMGNDTTTTHGPLLDHSSRALSTMSTRACAGVWGAVGGLQEWSYSLVGEVDLIDTSLCFGMLSPFSEKKHIL